MRKENSYTAFCYAPIPFVCIKYIKNTQLTLFAHHKIGYNIIYEVIVVEIIVELVILFIAFHFLFKDYKDAQRGDKVKGFIRGFLIFFVLLVLMSMVFNYAG